MRLFLARQVRLFDFERLKRQLSACVCCRWREETSLHATVLFTGERFDADAIISTVSALHLHPTDAAITGIDRFARNRILFAGASAPGLARDHQRVAEALGTLPDTPYVPHVTLMRYKHIDLPCFETRQALFEGENIGTIDGPLRLMNSVPGPRGAVYETLYVFHSDTALQST